MSVVNHTDRPFEEIATLEVIGRCRNEWRQRVVTVFSDPRQHDWCYTIGVPFDKTCDVIVTHEKKEGFTATLAVFPRTHLER